MPTLLVWLSRLSTMLILIYLTGNINLLGRIKIDNGNKFCTLQLATAIAIVVGSITVARLHWEDNQLAFPGCKKVSNLFIKLVKVFVFL